MAFKTFADTNILTASDVNTYLMKQSLIVCTSSTRPATPNEGMTIYETDTDKVLIYSGSAWENGLAVGAWTSYTPALSSDGAGTDWVLGNGTATGAYCRLGRSVIVRFAVTLGSTTTFGTKNLVLSLPPVASVDYGSQNKIYGSGIYHDVSGGAGYGIALG
jgi:hypothetical protein